MSQPTWLSRIDPELRPLLDVLPDPDITDPVAERAEQRKRTAATAASAQRPAGVRAEDRTVPGPQGAPAVPVRVYRPDPALPHGDGSRRPGVLVWMHGGGFVFGDPNASDGSCYALVAETGCTVVSVDYRLAPEHPFPAGFDDVYAVVEWAATHGDELGADVSRLAVGGISAGGCLAAAVALAARDRGGPRLAAQILDVPVLDDRCDTPSMVEFTDTPLWGRPSAVLSWQYYLAGAAASAYAAPARAGDLAGLPATFITANEMDPLRDEAMDYALRLMRAGVPVELIARPGTFHGSNAMPNAEVSRRTTQDLRNAVARAVGA